MSLLPAILALREVWVHVSFSDCSNVTPYIEISVNKTFSLTATLGISYIDPIYVQSGGYLDDVRFGY